MLGFLATDMYLPAFSAMQSELNTTAGAISTSLSIFLAGFAAGQLVWGPLSDRWGRKPILIIGLVLFSAGCLGMLWVDNMALLLALRFIQAVGVCAATVSWQALVVDRYSPNVTQRTFATIMPLVALSPALAPLLGAWTLNHLDWRAIFAILLTIGVLLLLTTLTLKESKSSAKNEQRSPSRGFISMLGNPVYIGNVLIYSSCSAGFFAWLTGSPFILHDMGYSPSVIGLSYVPQTIAFLVGGFGCKMLLARIGGKKLLPWLLTGYCISIVALYIVARFTEATLLALIIPFCLMALVNGACYPIVVANALTLFPANSGKAAALQNTLQLGLCFIASMLVSALISHPLINTVNVMLSTIVLVGIGYLLTMRKGLEMARNATQKSGENAIKAK